MNSAQHNKTTGREAEECKHYNDMVDATEYRNDPRPNTRGGMQARKQAIRTGRLDPVWMRPESAPVAEVETPVAAENDDLLG